MVHGGARAGAQRLDLAARPADKITRPAHDYPARLRCARPRHRGRTLRTRPDSLRRVCCRLLRVLDAQELRDVVRRALKHRGRERACAPEGVVLRVHVTAVRAVRRQPVVLEKRVQSNLVLARKLRVPARGVVHVAQLDAEAVLQRVRVHAAVVHDFDGVRVLEHGAQKLHDRVCSCAPEHVEDESALARRQLHETHRAKAPEVNALDVQREGPAASQARERLQRIRVELRDQHVHGPRARVARQ